MQVGNGVQTSSRLPVKYKVKLRLFGWVGLLGEVDGAAGLGGAARRVEDADDGDVGVEGGEIGLGVELVIEDGDEVVEGVVFGCGERRCRVAMLGGLVGEAHAELVGLLGVYVDGVDVAGGTVDLHVLAVEGPVP